MEKLSKWKCDYWSARAESIIDAMQRTYNKGSIDNIAELNTGVMPLDKGVMTEGEVIEIIRTNQTYAEAVRNHPLSSRCQVGELNIKGNRNNYYFVNIGVDISRSDNVKNLWVPTSLDAVGHILQQMGVSADSFLCDAGGADGRVAYLAPCRAVAIENNPALIRTAYKWAPWFNRPNVQIVEGDLYTSNYSEYTHIFTSLTYHDLDILSKKLAKEISKNTKVFTVLNPLDASLFKIEKAFPFVLNDSQLAPITVGLIQKLK